MPRLCSAITSSRVARTTGQFIGSSYDVAYYFGYKLPSYSLANARVGLARGRWSADLFVGNNLTNKIALITANNTSFQFNIPQVVRYSTNQPRTIGVTANLSSDHVRKFQAKAQSYLARSRSSEAGREASVTPKRERDVREMAATMRSF